MKGAQQGPARPTTERTMIERLALYSRGPVEIECRKAAEAMGERDLSVSGRLGDAAKLCALVREWLALPPDQKPVGTMDDMRYAAGHRLPSEK